MHPLEAIFRAKKAMSGFPGWSALEDETGYSRFNIPLEIEGLTEHGLFFRGGCYPSVPECHVTFELTIARSLGRRCTPLARLDWKAPTGHSNPRRPGHTLSGKRVGPTHLHTFEGNWEAKSSRMAPGNLRMADDVRDDLSTFEAARGFAGKYFGISNIDLVDRPNWEYTLFQGLGAK